MFGLSIFIIFTISLLVIYRKVSHRHLFNYFIIIILFILFSLSISYRPNFIPDTYEYILVYESVIPFSFNMGYGLLELNSGMEIGFIFLISILKFFRGSYQLFFFLVTIISTSSIVFGFFNIIKFYSSKFEKNSNFDLLIIYLLYISYFGLIHNSIELRAGLSIGFSLLGISFYINKRIFLGFSLILLSITFHFLATLALIALVIYRISTKYNTFFYFTLLLIFGFFLIFNSRQFISIFLIEIIESASNLIPFIELYIPYLLNSVPLAVFGFKVIFFYFLSWIFLFFKLDNVFYFKIFNIYLFGLFISIFFGNYFGIRRVSDYFLIFVILLLALINDFNFKKIYFKRILLFLVIVILHLFSLRFLTIL